jgi:putative redox protein
MVLTIVDASAASRVSAAADRGCGQLRNRVVVRNRLEGRHRWLGHEHGRPCSCTDEEVPMSLRATARSTPGTLRQDVVIDGRHRLVTDEPEHLGGEDAGPAPHELFPAALAACVSTTLVRYARTKEWDPGRVTVDVVYDHRSTPRTLSVQIEVTGDLDDEQIARLEKVAAACPLRRSIETGFVFEERIARADERRAA